VPTRSTVKHFIYSGSTRCDTHGGDTHGRRVVQSAAVVQRSERQEASTSLYGLYSYRGWIRDQAPSLCSRIRPTAQRMVRRSNCAR
jgi:hypothetical protein